MKTHVIQLERYDDVISTRDKMAWSKAARILLVWPEKGRILTRRLELTLLVCYSQQVGAQLGLVTRSRAVKANAHRLGIAVFDTIEQAQQQPWRPARRRRKPEPRRSVQERIALRERRPGRGRPGIQDQPLGRLLFFTLGVAAVLGLMLFFLPSARVTLAMEEQEQRLTLPIWANSEIAVPGLSGGIPARRVTVVVEGQDSLASSGQVTLPDQPAVGRVQFTNLAEGEVAIPAETVVLTLTQPPVRFLTTAPGVLPAQLGSKVEVPVRAVQAGLGGNVAAGQIRAVEGAIGVSVLVTNLEPTQGGSDRTSPAPTAADDQNLCQQLLAVLRQTAEKELQSQLSAGQTLLPATLQVSAILEESRLPELGRPADALRLRLRVEFSVWTVLQEDIERVALAALEANLPPGYTGVPDTLEIVAQTEPRLEGGSARWEIDARRRLRARLSENTLLGAAQGRSPAEVEQILTQLLDLRQPPEIHIWPAWWPRLPFLPFRIEVVQQ